MRERLFPPGPVVVLGRLLAVALAAAWVCGAAGAAPPADPPKVTTVNAPPADPADAVGFAGNQWLWFHYWEAHRNEFLTAAAQNYPANETPPPALDGAARSKAIKTLTDATDKKYPSAIRVAAALALGHAGDENSTDTLVALLKDQDAAVMEAAWIGLALVNSKKAREQILNPDAHPSEAQMIAWAEAVGVMKDPPSLAMQTLAGLVKDHGNDTTGIAPMAMWALRVHHPDGVGKLALAVVQNSLNIDLVSEALITLGEDRGQESIPLIKDVIVMPNGGMLPLTKAIWREGSPRGLSGGELTGGPRLRIEGVRTAAVIGLSKYDVKSNDRRSQRARAALMSLFNFNNPAPTTPQQVPAQGGIRGRIPQPPPMPTPTPSTTVYQPYQNYGFELRFAALALGQIGYTDEAEMLIKILRNAGASADANAVPVFSQDDPIRGYAELGLGFYFRRMTELGIQFGSTSDPEKGAGTYGDRELWHHNGVLETESPEQTRHTMRRVLTLLKATGSDPNEPASSRAACLLALGITGDSHRREEVLAILHSQGGQDRFVEAYGVLALAMLHDEQAAGLAEKMLGGTENAKLDAQAIATRATQPPQPGSEILVTDALMQALRCAPGQKAAALARGQYGLEHWVSSEAIQTLRASLASDLAEPLTELLETRCKEILATPENVKAKDPVAAVVAINRAVQTAGDLGQLLRPAGEDRLAKAVDMDVNFTLPIGPSWQVHDTIRSDSNPSQMVAGPLSGTVDQMAVERLANSIYRLRCFGDLFMFSGLAPTEGARVLERN